MIMAVEIRIFRAEAGLKWFKAGWELFKCQPGTFVFMHLFIGITSFIALLAPILQFPAALAMPFVTAGFYKAMLQRQQGQKIEIFELFSVFGEPGRRLMLFRLGLYHLFGGFILALITTSLFQGLGEPVNAYLQAVEAQNVDLAQVHAKQIIDSIQFSNVIVLVAAYSLYTMSFAYTVPLVYFTQNQSILECIKASLLVFWHNMAALGVFGLISAGLVVLSAFLSFIPLLFILPILYLSFFVSFQAMFMSAMKEIKATTGGQSQQASQDNDRFDA